MREDEAERRVFNAISLAAEKFLFSLLSGDKLNHDFKQ